MEQDFIDSLGERIWKENYERGKARIKSAVTKYVRVYGILFLITFTEAAVGLTLLKQPYTLLLALFISVVDIFPILGVGTVFVPWGIFSLFLENYRLGLGIFILYGIMTIVRQIIGPKLVGESIGIHPVVSLIFMFIGVWMLGAVGAIVAPFVALLIWEIVKH